MKQLGENITTINEHQTEGRVHSYKGELIEIAITKCRLGDIIEIATSNGTKIPTTVVAFSSFKALCLPFYNCNDLAITACGFTADHSNVVYPHKSWQGRIINGLARTIDGEDSLIAGDKRCLVDNYPAAAIADSKTENQRLTTGIRAIDTFIPCFKGSTTAIFSPPFLSGLNHNSSLLAALANNVANDITVIGLIGSHNQINTFINDNLKPGQREKAVIVAANTGEPAAMRLQVANMVMTISEYFSELGANVLCLIDDLTNFIDAANAIAIMLGQSSSHYGYHALTTTNRLLTRATNQSKSSGSITNFFQVMPDRGKQGRQSRQTIMSNVDAYITLDDDVNKSRRFPAIDIANSMTKHNYHNDAELTQAINEARTLIDHYQIIKTNNQPPRLNPKEFDIDKVIKFHHQIEEFISQSQNHYINTDESYAKLINLVYNPDSNEPGQIQMNQV